MPIEHKIRRVTVSVSQGKYKGEWELDIGESRKVLNKLEEKYRKTVAECRHGGLQYDFMIEPEKGSHRHATYWFCNKCAGDIVSLIRNGKMVSKGFEVFYCPEKSSMIMANEIAGALHIGIAADIQLTKEIKEKGSVIFLGCPGLTQGMSGFIARNNFKGRKVALFSTSARGLEDMEEKLKKEGANIIGKLLVERGTISYRPTKKHRNMARKFALEMKKASGK